MYDWMGGDFLCLREGALVFILQKIEGALRELGSSLQSFTFFEKHLGTKS